MRKPKKQTPLRQVRTATRMSQKEFAAYLGFGPDLYHSLELGRTTLTKKNEQTIALKTGALPESLNHKTSRLAMGDNHEPYTERTWREWQHNKRQRAEAILQWTEFLLMMAEKEDKLAQVCFELCDALTKARDKFDLRGITDCELKRTKGFHAFVGTYGYLRGHKKVADQVGFQDMDNAPDNAGWAGGYHYTLSWSPHSKFPLELAKRFQIFDRATDRLPASEKAKLVSVLVATARDKS